MATPLCMSVLLPAFQSKALGTTGVSVDSVYDTCSRQLTVDSSKMELFAMVPLTQQLLDDHKKRGEHVEIAVRMTHSDITLKKIE